MAVEGVGRGNVVPIELLRRMRAAQEQSPAEGQRASGNEPGAHTNPAVSEAAVPAVPPGPADINRPAKVDLTSATERAHLLERYREETADLPEVRRDKVIEAKVRISTGYYNRDEIRREVLRSVLEQLLPGRPAVEDPVSVPSPAPANVSGSATPAPENG